MKDYAFVSPSLEGILSHESMLYEGVRRPVEVFRALDGARVGKRPPPNGHDKKILEQYFYDLYGVFMKKFTSFMSDSSVSAADSVRLQAMLQEMIKTKKLMSD